ncbi:uncharacterized protein F5Z01DRAFT_690301 [Emericellopsis atlantica]|uniref:Uncharacterized protein n=1 Tax=Emericellopsis atlantica TaxID=2614577 RepID=A0A9P7ZI89_9HYPO|nr:uncharacterized protein F5Z01DRAFT_690301 [Emericellopsis atlantica]KAG9252604.1 hypothetical protein F5Z01DRAFT_690301 [Emericellopsis atlantica]
MPSVEAGPTDLAALPADTAATRMPTAAIAVKGSPQPYEPDPDDDKPLPACPYTPTTMDEIFNLDFYNELPAHCVPKYMVPVLHNMLETITKRYNEILEDDYDYYFGVYSGYLVDNANAVTHSFIKDTGDDYFDCDIWQQYPCCTNCEYLGVSCDGYVEKCVIESPYDDGVEWHLRDQPCPPDYSKRGMGDDWEQTIFWDFKDDEAKKNFYAAATAEVGAPEDKFKIAERSTIPSHNVPYVDGFEKENVVNPKDIVKKTIENADVLREPMAEAGFQLMVDYYEGDGHDLVDALILPVFMLQESVQYMEVVVKMGKEIKEAEKTALIVNLLSALLIVIGFGGSSLVAAGFSTLGRTLVYLAEAGNTAIGLHAVISVPESAPLLIFGLVMSAFGIRDASKVTQAAKLRRGMKFEEISAFSKEAARMMDSVAAFNKKPAVPQMCRYA